MRCLGLSITLLALAGCEDFQQAMEGERAPVSPPGIASQGDLDAVGQAAGGGQVEPAGQPQTQPMPQEPAPAQPAPQPPRSIIGQKTGEVLDLQKALVENPDWKMSDTKVSGNDPLTQAGSVYNRAAAVGGSAPLVQWIQQHKALNDRFPTHQEVVDWMRQNRAELPVLPANRAFAYDASTGQIVTLEPR